MVWTGLGYGVLTIAGLFVLGGLVRLTWRVWRGVCGGAVADVPRADAPAGLCRPSTFVTGHLTGSQPCVAVRDGLGRLWRVKWGQECGPNRSRRVLSRRAAPRRGHASCREGHDRERHRPDARGTASMTTGTRRTGATWRAGRTLPSSSIGWDGIVRRGT